MALQIDPTLPKIKPAQSLTGWRREFCIELLGDGAARIFVRVVEKSSFKAAELQRSILFHRLDQRFDDLAGCVEKLRPALERLTGSVKRTETGPASLFFPVEHDRVAWEQVQQGIDSWTRGSAALRLVGDNDQVRWTP
jgi:hypothetical protein